MWVLLCLQELCRGVGPAVFVGAMWRCGSCCVCRRYVEVWVLLCLQELCRGVGPAVFAGAM